MKIKRNEKDLQIKSTKLRSYMQLIFVNKEREKR